MFVKIKTQYIPTKKLYVSIRTRPGFGSKTFYDGTFSCWPGWAVADHTKVLLSSFLSATLWRRSTVKLLLWAVMSQRLKLLQIVVSRPTLQFYSCRELSTPVDYRPASASTFKHAGLHPDPVSTLAWSSASSHRFLVSCLSCCFVCIGRWVMYVVLGRYLGICLWEMCFLGVQ